MTGKQRFEAVMNHEKPDKLPLYIPTVASGVASEILGRPVITGADSLHFYEELSLFHGADAHAEFEEKLVADTADLLRALRVDVVRETWRCRSTPTKRLDEFTLLFGDPDGAHTVKRYFPEQDSYGVLSTTETPDADALAARLEESVREPLALPTKEESLRSIASDRRLFDALRADALGEIISGGGFGITMYDPALLMLCATEPDLLREVNMRESASEEARMRHLADAGYRWFNGGLDMASNEGTIYSPAAFRYIMLEPLRRFAAACAEKNTIFCYRTDGNIWSVFDDMFTEAGIQAYGEVDRDASMTVERVRAANENLVVLGNTSSAFLRLATPEEIREDTFRQLEGAKGTNFIPGPSNAIVQGTPAANIFAMVEAIEAFGRG